MLQILKETIETGEKLFILFTAIKAKITGDEKAAAKDLQFVIDEVVKFFKATQEEISDFQSLDFSSQGNASLNKKTLYDIDCNMMQVRISEASGSCAKISRVYDACLKTWFGEVFKGQVKKRDEAKILFEKLAKYDVTMVHAAKDLGKHLKEKANEIILLLPKNDWKSISACHDRAANELMPFRTKLSQVVKQLVDLKNEFMESAKIL